MNQVDVAQQANILAILGLLLQLRILQALLSLQRQVALLEGNPHPLPAQLVQVMLAMGHCWV